MVEAAQASVVREFLNARARLLPIVPLALAFILFLLWMAFRELRAALLLFLDVPFAVVGLTRRPFAGRLLRGAPAPPTPLPRR